MFVIGYLHSVSIQLVSADYCTRILGLGPRALALATESLLNGGDGSWSDPEHGTIPNI